MVIEYLSIYPKISIVAISFLVTLAMTLTTKKFTNQNRMKELKEIQSACKIKLKDNKGNPQKTGEINKEMLECSMELMKHSMKPMLITFIPLILLLGWVRGIYMEILPGWIWWYIVSGIIFSMTLRKVLKVH